MCVTVRMSVTRRVSWVTSFEIVLSKTMLNDTSVSTLCPLSNIESINNMSQHALHVLQVKTCLEAPKRYLYQQNTQIGVEQDEPRPTTRLHSLDHVHSLDPLPPASVIIIFFFIQNITVWASKFEWKCHWLE